MQRGWLTVLGWVLKPIALLVAFYALLRWWAG